MNKYIIENINPNNKLWTLHVPGAIFKWTSVISWNRTNKLWGYKDALQGNVFLHILCRHWPEKQNIFLNVPILCFQEHYENTQFQPRKIYSFHPMEKVWDLTFPKLIL